MTGAFAERMRYRSFIILIVLWEIVVYYPLAHWIWGGGWLAQLGVQDFAGGIVIHTSAGIGSLISALSMAILQVFLSSDDMCSYRPTQGL